MSAKKNDDFKAKVALEAMNQTPEFISELADKYEVSVKEINEWVEQLKSHAAETISSDEPAPAPAAKAKTPAAVQEEFTIQVDQDFTDDLAFGATADRLDLRMITKWFILGSITVLILIIFGTKYGQYALHKSQMEASEGSSYEAITKLHKEQLEKLNSFGVIDIDKGIYHIPIDEAINQIAAE